MINRSYVEFSILFPKNFTGGKIFWKKRSFFHLAACRAVRQAHDPLVEWEAIFAWKMRDSVTPGINIII